MLGILLTIYAGLEHAFEADHLLAVNNLVTHRNNIKSALKDGIFWGIGHTATIFFIGILMMVFKFSISGKTFSYFEACVGIMLVLLGIYRIVNYFLLRKKKTFFVEENVSKKAHTAAFGVGMIHGLAGSGALVVLVMSQMKTPLDGLGYLIIYGMGSIIGMFIAAGVFSIPFSREMLKSEKLQMILIVLSSLLCIIYGGKVIFENIQ